MARKITKVTLDELKKEMAPLTEQEQQARLGGAGYDEGDSWWRCIEYFKSGTLGWQDLQRMGGAIFHRVK